MRLFSTEQVSKFHPDKYCDQISDAILDECLRKDKGSRVAIETMAKGDMVVVCGELTTTADFSVEKIVKQVAQKLGYHANKVIVNISKQSAQIAGGVKNGRDTGAGDQGIMFGYATRETDSFLPYGFDLANKIIAALEFDATQPLSYLQGDAKTQVTVDLDAEGPDSIKKVLISACHKESLKDVREYVLCVLEEAGFDFIDKDLLLVNPAGRWTIGGPIADCGLTGRKIVCDQYGGYVPVGGGAFSGKDPSKVDRTAAYMANVIARDLVRENKFKECSVQLAYAIGMKEPMSVQVSTPLHEHDEMLAEYIKNRYDLTPYGMIEYLNLLNGGFEKRSEGCHYRYPFMTKGAKK